MGAGACGIGAAHYLKERFPNERIGIFEAGDKSNIGGKVHSVEVDGRNYDMGAGFILHTYDRVYELISKYKFSCSSFDTNIFSINSNPSQFYDLTTKLYVDSQVSNVSASLSNLLN